MIINVRTANMFGLTAPLSLLGAGRRHADRRVEFGTGAAGDRRPESNLKTISPRRDRNSETTTREKWPQKRPFC